MLVETIRKRVTEAMKAGDAVAKDVLRVALGEIQTAEARAARALTDDEAVAVVRKLIKSNEETLGMTEAAERKALLVKETEVLRSLLPAAPSMDDLVAALAPVRDAVRAAKSDGQAIGVAMKHLKGAGLSAGGADVAEAVKRVRA
jgi:uncharacterized protein YqeY